MRIDAHQHFWNVGRLHYPVLDPNVFGAWHRNVEPPELEPLLKERDIAGTVVVQAKNGLDETEYLLELSDRHDWIKGVVGWVDLTDRTLAVRQLKRLEKHAKFKGVRHLFMSPQERDWLIRPETIAGLKALAEAGKTFDVSAEFPHHLRHVPEVARQVPDLRIVIDHLAKPPADGEGLERWEADLARASLWPNVCAKVSGLDPHSPHLRAIVDTAFRLFGAERLMFGSDWPVACLGGSYEDVWQAVNDAVSGRTEREKEALFGGTAERFYRLAP